MAQIRSALGLTVSKCGWILQRLFLRGDVERFGPVKHYIYRGIDEIQKNGTSEICEVCRNGTAVMRLEAQTLVCDESSAFSGTRGYSEGMS